MRPIVQSQAAECGLASLAMVADHHGHCTDLAEFRRRFSVSLKGASLNRLIGIAQQLGFQTRALRLDMQHLSQLRLPCILHWDLDHFVVLAKVGRNTATVLDPAFGERKLGHGELSLHFTGVALELTPGAEFKPQQAPPAIRISQLTGPVRGLWRSLAQILLLSVRARLPVQGGNTVKLIERMADTDEGPRADTSIEGLAKLKAVFRMGGSVAGVRPEVMGIGPIAAIPKALKQAGLNQDQLDWIELNEAFAAQALAVIRSCGLDPNKVNPLGGAIALGHPLGATGAIRTATIVHGLRRRQQKYGMVTMCIGTGMGAAGIFEAL